MAEAALDHHGVPAAVMGALPSLREALEGAFADRRRILAVGGAVLGVALLAAVLIPAKYAASSSLVVLLGSEFTLRPEAGAPPVAASPMTSDQIMKAEIEVLSGDDLHEQVVRRIGLTRLYPEAVEPPGLVSQARTALQDGFDALERAIGIEPAPRRALDPATLAVVDRFDPALTVEATKDANVLTVTFRHKDPALAALVVNDLVAAYLARRRELYGDAQSGPVQAQTAAAARALSDADARLAAFKATHGISSYDTERDLLLHRRDTLLRAASDARGARAALTARLALLSAQVAATPHTVLSYSETDPDAKASAAMAGLQDARGKAADLAARFLPDSRVMTDVRAGVAEREAELKRVQASHGASAVRTTRNASLDSLLLDQAHAQADRGAAEATERDASAQVAALDVQLRTLDQDEDQLSRLERTRAVSESLYKDAAKTLEDRRMVEAVAAERAADVRVIQAAREPVKPRPLKLILALVGVVGSLLAMAGTAVLGEALRPGFLLPEALERRTGLTVLAAVPELV